MCIFILLVSIVVPVLYLLLKITSKQRMYVLNKEYDQRFTVTPCSNSSTYYKFKRNL